MKVKFRQFVWLLGITGVMLLSSNAYSQTGGDYSARHEEMREKMKATMVEIFKQLALSPEQEVQLEVHRNKHREQVGEFHKKLKAKKEEITNELQRKELDIEKIYKIHSEMKYLLSEKADRRLEGILGVRKILTAEQFSKFCELKKDLHPMKKMGKGLY